MPHKKRQMQLFSSLPFRQGAKLDVDMNTNGESNNFSSIRDSQLLALFKLLSHCNKKEKEVQFLFWENYLLFILIGS